MFIKKYPCARLFQFAYILMSLVAVTKHGILCVRKKYLIVDNGFRDISTPRFCYYTLFTYRHKHNQTLK